MLNNNPIDQSFALQDYAASLGFDWGKPHDVINKVREELNELVHELSCENIDQSKAEEEFGDVYFSLLNLARKANIDSSSALALANQKFAKRFSCVEKLALDMNASLEDMTLEEMGKLWQKAKNIERGISSDE